MMILTASIAAAATWSCNCPFIQQIRTDTSYYQMRWQEGMGRNIWESEISTGWLDQCLWIFQASLLPVFLLLYNVTSTDIGKQVQRGNNKSTIEWLYAISSSSPLVLAMCCSSQECVCFVQTVGCSNAIRLWGHRWLTTLKRITGSASSSPIARCAKHQIWSLRKGIHCRSNGETIRSTSKWWCMQLRQVRNSDRKEDNIWKINQLESPKASFRICNVSPERLVLYPILCIL